MQLNPQSIFAIVRQIDNHTDENTYYIRAVIRNAQTDALIETVDLTDQGERRFSKNWKVPADVSGAGFYISILTSVYTDSGYTTKSATYSDEMATYLVAERYNHNLSGGGGGSDISYKKIREIISEEIAKQLGGIKFPSFPKVDKVPLGEAMVDLKRFINTNKPIIPKTDLSALETKLKALDKLVDLDKLDKVLAHLGQMTEEIKVLPSRMSKPDVSEMKAIVSSTHNLIGKDLNDLTAQLKKNSEIDNLLKKRRADKLGKALGLNDSPDVRPEDERVKRLTKKKI